ncbi:tetratricopeptide repeat protein [Pseudorhodoferax sp.]|uniref:tetratricopeptide repeat protein n=1 Tax=Pseudorhodoferax sp. TaxID=1993553 RepID=UPI002DD65055|nr:tetratricopeptide repeat protein [Pseudorhodoferax sp.]
MTRRPGMPWTLAGALLLALPAAHAQDDGAGAARDAQQVFARVSPSVVTVLALDSAGRPDGQGSGVVVAPGLVATNCHVVRGAATLRLAGAGGEQAAQWTRQLAGLDLCLLAAPGLSAPPVALRTSQELSVGEPVYAVGNPLGFGLAVSSGLLSSRQEGQPHVRLAATAPVSPGSSGGGLFDRQGRLLGLTTAILGTGQSLNLVLPAEALAELLAKGEPRPAAEPVPPAERRWKAEASELFARNAWAELHLHAQQWIQAQPTSANALVYLTRAKNRQGRYAEAEATARRALALDNDLGFAWTELGEALIGQDRVSDAEQALREAALRDPSNANPNIQRSLLHSKAGRKEAARDELQLAVRKWPSNPRLWTSLGQLEEQLGRADDARRAFAAAERLGGALAKEETAATGRSAHARQVEALAALGWVELRNQRPVQAEAAFRKGLALDARHVELWNGLGTVMHHLHRWADAEDAYTRALALAPNDAAVLGNRGAAYAAAGQTDKAMADVQAALRIQPGNERAQRLLAGETFNARNYRAAAAAYARLAEIATPTADDLVMWAESLLKLNDVPAAQALLRQAETKTPPSPRLDDAMGKLLAAQNDLAGALPYFERVRAANPTQAQAWSTKGYALFRLERLSEAIETLETAVRLDPTLANAWINLGQAQLRARNLGRAIEALEKSIVLAPEAADARLYLAQSYLQVRMPAKAREQAQAVLARMPSAPPMLAIMAVTDLLEHRVAEAAAWHGKLHAVAPEIAGKVRMQAISSGVMGALQWPE